MTSRQQQQSFCRYIYSHNIHLGAAPRLALSTDLLVHIGAGFPPHPFNHHSRRSPRVRLALLHVITPSLPLPTKRVWSTSTCEHRVRVCPADSYTSTNVLGALVLSASSAHRRCCLLFLDSANARKQCIKTQSSRPLYAITSTQYSKLPRDTIVLISIPNIVRNASCRTSPPLPASRVRQWCATVIHHDF